MPNSYDVGDQVRCSGTFRDADTHALVDPATVVFQYRDPSRNITTLTTPDVSIANPSTGLYQSVIDVDEDTKSKEFWYYRWSSTVDYKAAGWGSFTVNDDPFT